MATECCAGSVLHTVAPSVPAPPGRSRRRLLRGAGATLLLGAAGALQAGCRAGAGGRPGPTPAVGGTIVATYPISRMEEITYKKLFRLTEERYPGLKIDEIGIAGSPPDQITTMFAGGTPPDAIRMSGAREYTFFAAKGFTQPLDAFFKRGDYAIKDVVPFALEGGAWRGKQVAMVFHLGGNAIYFNKTLLAQKGVKLPSAYDSQGQWNWTTLLEVLRGVSGGSGESRTWGMNRVESLDLANAWIYSAEGELYDKDITVSSFTHPRTMEALQYLVDLVLKHRVVPTVADQAGQGEIFMQGTQGTIFTARFNAPVIEVARKSAGWEVGRVLPPRGPTGKLYTRESPVSYGMGSQTSKPEAVWAMMKVFAGPEGQKIYGGDGIGLPVLRSLYTPEVLKGVLYEWEDLPTYLRSVEHARIQVAPAYQEVNAVFQRELRLCFDGQKSVRDAAEAMKREIDPLLKQYA
jgi:multiple sugar transport system substrate-binding protein